MCDLERTQQTLRKKRVGRQPRHVVAVEKNMTGSRFVQAGDDIEEGRFAGAIRAD